MNSIRKVITTHYTLLRKVITTHYLQELSETEAVTQSLRTLKLVQGVLRKHSPVIIIQRAWRGRINKRRQDEYRELRHWWVCLFCGFVCFVGCLFVGLFVCWLVCLFVLFDG